MSLYPWPKRLKSLLLSCKDKQSVAKTHALFLSTGLFIHGNSNALLVKVYAHITDAATARKLFDKLPQRGIDTWNAMIIAYSRQNLLEEAVRLYQWMVSEGVKPDSSSFTVALKACTNLSDLKTGEEIWSNAIDHGYERDEFVGSSVLNLYAKCGKINEAAKVFDKLPSRDLVSYTSMINGFTKSARPLEAINVYRRMQNEGVRADGVVMLGLIQACVSLGDEKMASAIHGSLVRRDISMDVVLLTSLVDMYGKIGKLGFAREVFRSMDYKYVSSWSAMISGYAQNGFSDKALEMLMEMQNCRFKPDLSALVSALQACGKEGFLKSGRSIHGYIARRLDFDQICATAIVDMYSKCGSLSYANALFNTANEKDLIFWNVMISCYAIHGRGKEALTLFLEMIESGLKPDQTTFASLLSAFSHSGLEEEGRYWFKSMYSEYVIPYGEKHYLCMVDLLARAGKVEEAYELIGSMNIEPRISVWVTLLAGCNNHGKVLIGEIAAKKILELGPQDLGIFALVSNFYAKERKWTEVAGLKNIMKHAGTRKVPGYSAIEVSGKFHSFVMGDQNHRQCGEIMQFLKILNHEMRIIGFVTDSDMLCDLKV